MRGCLLLVPLLVSGCDGNVSGGKNVKRTGGDSGNCAVDGCTGSDHCSVTGVCLPPGGCVVEADCAVATDCNTVTGKCEPGGECGWQEAVVEAVPSNLLISLDRSCSMRNNVGGTPKWTIAVEAINTMTTNFAGQIRFGLALFPDIVAPNCEQDLVDVPVGDNNETTIQGLLTAALDTGDINYPDGPCVTNIDTAMQQAAAEPTLDASGYRPFVLLITDGQQSGCSAAGGDDGTTSIIDDLFQDRGIPTFVIGFGSGVDPAQLNIFADAGGVPSSDPTARFYKAEDAASLAAALETIASQTLGCVYRLDTVPEDPVAGIYVFLDDDPMPIPRDTTKTEGWDHDPTANTVTFYGATCDALLNGTISEVDVVLGCYEPSS